MDGTGREMRGYGRSRGDESVQMWGSASQLPRHQSWQNLACESRLTMLAYVSNFTWNVLNCQNIAILTIFVPTHYADQSKA